MPNVRFSIAFIFYPISSSCAFKKFNIINKISGEKSNPEWVAGIRFRIGASTGSVISKTNTVNLLFEEYGNHDINTLASRM
jgi:hypothetical protein|tara:strand:+ start:187 stop:429 length:243 start_codon:yes stop_codon:yes gene_type:complete